jgi:predicted DNA-binding antitoxin AbrB/MazE fold protein
MELTFDATYQDGTLIPLERVDLPEGAVVRVIVRDQSKAGATAGVDPLAAVIGICDGPADSADNHDEYIYGE